MQNAGLIGSEGLTPAQDLVEETKASFGDMRGWDRVKAFPSLFLFVPPTDFWLNALALLGEAFTPKMGRQCSSKLWNCRASCVQ